MVLLGNPTLKKPRNAAMRTRFKMWWRLVGSAVEHAAELAARYDGEAKAARAALEPDKQVVDFCALFIDQDADDEEDSSLVEALTEFRAWAARTKVERKATGRTFSAADLALVHQRHLHVPQSGARRLPRVLLPRPSNRDRECPRSQSAGGSKAGSTSRCVAMA